MNHSVVILTTVDSYSFAKELASLLLEQKLAACIQIEKIESIYRWEGNICCDDEYKISIKTKASHYDAVERLIKKNHPYDTPEIIVQEIKGGSKEYLDYIDEVT